MKKFAAILLLVFAATALLAQPVAAKEQQIQIFTETKVNVQGVPYVRTDTGIVGQRVTVSGGNFTGMVIPSWYYGILDFYVLVYRWAGDYAQTVQGKLLFCDRVQEDAYGMWIDPGQEDFEIDFDRAFAPGDYLIEYRFASNDPLYVPTLERVEGAAAYLNAQELEGVSYQMTLVVDDEAPLHEEPNVKYEVDTTKRMVGLYGIGASSDGLSNLPLSTVESVGQAFTVDSGKLTGFVINSLVIETELAEVTLKLYKWDTDYTTTVKRAPAFEKLYVLEPDPDRENYNCEMMFDGCTFAEGKYLVTLESLDGANLWTHAAKENVSAYVDGAEYSGGTFKLSYLVNDHAQVNETPTQTGTTAPTVTDKPTAPLNTDVQPSAAATATGDADHTNSVVVPVIVLSIAVIVAVIVVVIVLKSKKNKGESV